MKSSEPPSDADIVRPAEVAPDAIMRVLRVAPEARGMRLDVFVQTQLRRTSRTRAKAIVEKGAYDAAGKRLRPNDRVRPEQRVVLWRAPFEEEELELPLPVVYEDPHLLVIDKPPLVAVHPTARYHRYTVIMRLLGDRPNERLFLIHRLDRETSGLLLIARTPEADRAFKRMLEERSMSEVGLAKATTTTFEKTYLTITWGIPEEGIIDRPLELDPHNPLRVKMRIAEPGRGLPAKTGVRVLERRGQYALVECKLYTGRQHQIRLHLASTGCPVVGDKLYGPDERLLARGADGELTEQDLELLELPRHALHAHQYRLLHAITGEWLELTSPLPDDLRQFWAEKPR